MEKESSQASWIAAPFIALSVLHLPALVMLIESKYFGTAYATSWSVQMGIYQAVHPIYRVTLWWFY